MFLSFLLLGLLIILNLKTQSIMSKEKAKFKDSSMAISLWKTKDSKWKEHENIVVIQNIVKTKFSDSFLNGFFFWLWWMIATGIVIWIAITIAYNILQPYISSFLR